MSSTKVLEQAFSDISTNVIFTRRPDPIPGDLRTGWRLASLVLILQRCRGNTANLEQIHVLAWSVRSTQGREVMRTWFSARRKPNGLIIRHDPATSRTINLAVAAGLASRNDNASITLTGKGERLATLLWANTEVLSREKEFLSTLPARITQKSIDDLLEWRL
ncbi:hypothetical protein ACFYVL_32705 [Streptomyces sp. NPDC004111]|uniref:hypothetical protein n=1 Tax=Streptomyces sp. NPDC004111 TaxID=3364690 RepID=UPI00368DC9E8